MDKDRFKLIVRYNGCRNLSLRFFQMHKFCKPELAAFSRIFDYCSQTQGYRGAGKGMDFICHEGLADDIIEIGLALGIPVKYVPEHKPKEERRHSEGKLDRLIDMVQRAYPSTNWE